MYGLSVGDKSGDLGLTLAYFFGKQNFFTTNISHTFVRAQGNLAALGIVTVEIYSPNFVNVGPVIPCGDMHQSFTDKLVKWFFDNFPMFADSFTLPSIHFVVR